MALSRTLWILIIIFVIVVALTVMARTNSMILVLGGAIETAHIATSYRTQNYDEYDDESLLDTVNPDATRTTKHIIVDGANFIHYNMGYENHSYLGHIRRTVEIFSKIFPHKNIWIALKDPPNKKKILEEIKSDKEYEAGFKEYANGFLKKYPKVRFVMGVGKDKARDDFTAIYLADLLGNEVKLITRDRYRDIQNISGSEPVKFNVFGKSTKLVLHRDDVIPNIGKWSFHGKLMGYVRINSPETEIWTRRVPKGSEASDLVIRIGTDVT